MTDEKMTLNGVPIIVSSKIPKDFEDFEPFDGLYVIDVSNVSLSVLTPESMKPLTRWQKIKNWIRKVLHLKEYEWKYIYPDWKCPRCGYDLNNGVWSTLEVSDRTQLSCGQCNKPIELSNAKPVHKKVLKKSIEYKGQDFWAGSFKTKGKIRDLI